MDWGGQEWIRDGEMRSRKTHWGREREKIKTAADYLKKISAALDGVRREESAGCMLGICKQEGRLTLGCVCVCVCVERVRAAASCSCLREREAHSNTARPQVPETP